MKHLLSGFLLNLICITGIAEAAEPAFVERHRGVTFAAMDAPPDYIPDIPLLPLDEGVQRLKTALDRLEQGAPSVSREIDRLRNAGDVVVVYHPVFPRRQSSAITAAAFFPQFFDPASADKTFLVIFGRYGVKWSLDDIALVLAHELAGHGIQHLEKRLPAPTTIDTDPYARRKDFECEANLYSEWARQQMRLGLESSRLLNQRLALERHWCKPFIQWLSRNGSPLASEWGKPKPNVPTLLPALRRFITTVAEEGIHTGYQSATIEQARIAAAAMRDSSVSSLYLQGRKALENGEVDKAIALLEVAAERRFNRAALLLADILLDPAHGGPYTEEARAHLEAARTRGSRKAAEKLQALPTGD